jgi:hypothetical protein
MKFPEVKGRNLENIEFTIPADLKGNYNLLIIPFQQWHQSLVDQWIPFLESIKKDLSGFYYYEIPTLNESYKTFRFVIDGGMRAGIPDKAVRERTITLYINKTKFKSLLNISSEETIFLYLTDKKGTILWNSEGEFTGIKGENLKIRLNELKSSR